MVDGIPANVDEIQVESTDLSNIEQSINDYSNYIQIIANSVLEQCKDRGSISGGLYEVIKKLIKIKIPWHEILDDCIKVYSQVDFGSKTWRIPNKYFVALNITLPGDDKYDLKPNTLIITVDSSGSISSKNLKQFSYVIYNNFKHFNKIIVMVHDVKIHEIKEFTESLQFLEFIKNVGFKGRGGTSHKYVFKKIEKMYEDHLDELSMVISLTDNYSDIEYCCQKFKFWKTVPYVILTNGAILKSLPKEIKQIKIEGD